MEGCPGGRFNLGFLRTLRLMNWPGDVVRMWIGGYLVLEGSGSRVCNGSIQLNRILPTTFPVILDYTSAS